MTFSDTSNCNLKIIICLLHLALGLVIIDRRFDTRLFILGRRFEFMGLRVQTEQTETNTHLAETWW